LPQRLGRRPHRRRCPRHARRLRGAYSRAQRPARYGGVLRKMARRDLLLLLHTAFCIGKGCIVADEASETPGPFDIKTLRLLVALMSRNDLSEIDLRNGEQR